MPLPSTIATLNDITVTHYNTVVNALSQWGGDVNAGSNNLANLRQLTFRQNTPPAAPATGDITFYMDAADSKVKFKTPDGVAHTFGFYTTQALTGAINGTDGTDGNAVFTYNASAAPPDHFLFKAGIKMIQDTAYTLAYAAGAVTITFLSPYKPVTGDLLELRIS